MRIQICAVGRFRSGPEHDLVRDYLQRFEKTGRQIGLGPVRVTEVEDRKGIGQTAEAELLLKAIPDQNTLWCLDERGTQMTSPEFATAMAALRDDGASELTIAIGGADGLTKDLRSKAQKQISFGKLVWPHALARVMLAEQIYRAATILAGSPYHRA